MSSTHTLTCNISPQLWQCNSYRLPRFYTMPHAKSTEHSSKNGINKHQSHSATGCLRQLHWLPIKSRIEYKVLTIVFKCKHGMAPKYLQDLLEAQEHCRQGLKSNNKQLLKVPITTRRTFADRSFSVKGPRLWNDLPNSIWTITSYTVFKKQLKIHLFNICYK